MHNLAQYRLLNIFCTTKWSLAVLKMQSLFHPKIHDLLLVPQRRMLGRKDQRTTLNLQHFHIKWLISMLEPAHWHSTAPDFYHCNWKWLLKVIQYNSLNKKLKGKLHQPPLRFHKMTIPTPPPPFFLLRLV